MIAFPLNHPRTPLPLHKRLHSMATVMEIKDIKEIRIEPPPARYTDALDRLCELLDLIAGSRSGSNAPYRTLYVYVDVLYGAFSDVPRNGNRTADMISTLTILLDTGTTTAHVYHIDVLTFGSRAFETPGFRGRMTLKDILESSQFPKVFYDVRPGAYALFTQYQINLRGVTDIQLLESASRNKTVNRSYLRTLTECIGKYSPACIYGPPKFYLRKERDRVKLLEAHDGSATALSSRPTSTFILKYCTSMVQYLPELLRMFSGCDNSHRLRELLLLPAIRERIARLTWAPPSLYGTNQQPAPWSQFEHTYLDMIHSEHITPSGNGNADRSPAADSVPIRARGWPRASRATVNAILAQQDADTIEATKDQAGSTGPARENPLLDPWSDELSSFLEYLMRRVASATTGTVNNNDLREVFRGLEDMTIQLMRGQDEIMEEYDHLIQLATEQIARISEDLARGVGWPPSDLNIRRGHSLMDLAELKHVLVEDGKIQARLDSLILGMKALTLDLLMQLEPAHRDLRAHRQRIEIGRDGYFWERRP